MPATRRDGLVRDQIVEAAAAALAEGDGELTVRDVIARAGVSNGTLYHYFPSLDLLLLAVAQRASAAQPDAFGSPGSASDLLAVLGRLFASERADTVLPWLRHKAISDHSLRVALRRYDREVRDRLVSALEGLPAGVVRRNVDLEAAVEVVRCLAEGYQLRQRSGTLGVQPDRFLDALLDLLRRSWAPGIGR